MKWLILLLIALIVTMLGVMYTEGSVQYVFHIVFFFAIVVAIVLLGTGVL